MASVKEHGCLDCQRNSSPPDVIQGAHLIQALRLQEARQRRLSELKSRWSARWTQFIIRVTTPEGALSALMRSTLW